MQAHWKIIVGILLLAGCSQGYDRKITGPENHVPVKLEIGYEFGLNTRALEDGTQNVDRITVLFFQKINEAGSNTDNTNFTLMPSYTLQQNVSSFPVQVAQTIAIGHTYKAFIVGYNQTDYGDGTDRFSFAGGQTLDQYEVLLNAANSVPQFFGTACTAFQGSTNLGTAFSPATGDPVKLQGALKRTVSGISFSVTGIPPFVKSISLRAGSLATAMKVVDRTPDKIINSGGSLTLATLVPVSGSILFENLLLPIWNGNSSKLYLDVAYDSTVESYEVKVQNSSISLGNNITFAPNTVVKITGTYNSINLGFVISDNINLDDNAWDGLQ